MSAAVKAAVLASKDLKPADRLMLTIIAAHQNTEGNAWPSVDTIAEYMGCSKRTVQRGILRLVEAGKLVVSKVAGIPTHVYRIIVDAVKGVTSAVKGVTKPASGVTDSAPGGDTQGMSPEVEDHKEDEGRAAARDWRRWIPKTKTANPQRQAYPERRGAALPPDSRTDQCSRHRGSPAGNCGPCRSEALGGAR